jgi:hypothetical protein
MSNSLRNLIKCVVSMMIVAFAAFGLRADTGSCGGASASLPFTDVVGSPFFCQIAEAFFSALIDDTSGTKFDPQGNVTREQMAGFITRTQDSALGRASKRAALGQFWTTTPHYDLGLARTTVGGNPSSVKSDGADLWVVGIGGNTVVRVRSSDGTLLGKWKKASEASHVLVAMGRVFVTADTNPGSLYMIDPAQPPGPVSNVAGNEMTAFPSELSFDGGRVWTVHGGALSIVTPLSTIPWSFKRVGGFRAATGITFDGSNIWVTDQLDNTLMKLDQNGVVIKTINVGMRPRSPVFDGTNIWTPNSEDNSVSVVRASTGVVIATLTGNGLNGPLEAAFDGVRILVTSPDGSVVSLWKAADLTPIGSFSTGHFTLPRGVCSDGVNFWITLTQTGHLVRF